MNPRANAAEWEPRYAHRAEKMRVKQRIEFGEAVRLPRPGRIRTDCYPVSRRALLFPAPYRVIAGQPAAETRSDAAAAQPIRDQHATTMRPAAQIAIAAVRKSRRSRRRAMELA